MNSIERVAELTTVVNTPVAARAAAARLEACVTHAGWRALQGALPAEDERREER